MPERGAVPECSDSGDGSTCLREFRRPPHWGGIVLESQRRRFGEHECGGPRAAKYLRGRGPLRLVVQVEVGDRTRAARLEYCVKALARTEKERLVGCPALLQAMAEAIET